MSGVKSCVILPSIANNFKFYNKLDKTERAVIYKYYIEGLTKKDISVQMGVSAMQVGRIIKRVLNKMYNILKKDFYTAEREEK